MSRAPTLPKTLPSIRVDVVEPGTRARRDRVRCEIGENLRFDTEGLEAYCLATWQPLVFDAFVVAAAVQFCDHTKARPATGWGREIGLRVPDHDPAHLPSSAIRFDIFFPAFGSPRARRWPNTSQTAPIAPTGPKRARVGNGKGRFLSLVGCTNAAFAPRACSDA